MPNIAGFSAIFVFLRYRDIFSNLPVLSQVFSCNIGKIIGKNHLFTNGLSTLRHTEQFFLHIIELHMGIGVQRHADVRMSHDVL